MGNIITEEDLANYKKKIEEDEDLIDFLLARKEPGWLYERYIYFKTCVGDNCKYADACVKLMKEAIDEFYSGRRDETGGGTAEDTATGENTADRQESDTANNTQ